MSDLANRYVDMRAKVLGAIKDFTPYSPEIQTDYILMCREIMSEIDKFASKNGITDHVVSRYRSHCLTRISLDRKEGDSK